MQYDWLYTDRKSNRETALFLDMVIIFEAGSKDSVLVGSKSVLSCL